MLTILFLFIFNYNRGEFRDFLYVPFQSSIYEYRKQRLKCQLKYNQRKHGYFWGEKHVFKLVGLG